MISGRRRSGHPAHRQVARVRQQSGGLARARATGTPERGGDASAPAHKGLRCCQAPSRSACHLEGERVLRAAQPADVQPGLFWCEDLWAALAAGESPKHEVLRRWCEALGQKYWGQRLAGLAHKIFLRRSGKCRRGGEADSLYTQRFPTATILQLQTQQSSSAQETTLSCEEFQVQNCSCSHGAAAQQPQLRAAVGGRAVVGDLQLAPARPVLRQKEIVREVGGVGHDKRVGGEELRRGDRARARHIAADHAARRHSAACGREGAVQALAVQQARRPPR